jgi:3-phosphoshikimate 1-carboxyvinyltransferase
VDGVTDLRIEPGGVVEGAATVPGDKSIAHRWLIFAATAIGTSRLSHLPPALDVRSTASVLGALAPKARRALDVWARNGRPAVEGVGSTWNADRFPGAGADVEVEGKGREGLVAPAGALMCGNSGTTLRLTMGVLAGCPVTATLTGDASLSARPMERVAAPLRSMGAAVSTTGGHPPVLIRGGLLRAIDHTTERPSAQVKSAVLLAGLAAEGRTSVTEAAPTRDHTERFLEAVGAPVRRVGLTTTVERFQHEAFEATVPGDVSSAAFLIGAALLTGGGLTIDGVGLNPTRLHFIEVLRRMGATIDHATNRDELGEPVGTIRVEPRAQLQGTVIGADEVPLIIDEVPLLAAIAAHAAGETWFHEASELRVKESDRLTEMARGLRGLGGHAVDEGDDLVVAGTGLRGGAVEGSADHRVAMALAVAALGAEAPCVVRGASVADVSFPGFAATIGDLGGRVVVP